MRQRQNEPIPDTGLIRVAPCTFFMVHILLLYFNLAVVTKQFAQSVIKKKIKILLFYLSPPLRSVSRHETKLTTVANVANWRWTHI